MNKRPNKSNQIKLNQHEDVYELQDEELEEEYAKYHTYSKSKEGFNSNEVIKEESIESDNQEEPIYIMTLEIEEGKAANIEIFNNTDPEKLANLICEEYGLDINALDYLKNEIANLIIAHREKHESSQDETKVNNVNNYETIKEEKEKETNENENEVDIIEENPINIENNIIQMDNKAQTYFNIRSKNNYNEINEVNKLLHKDIQGLDDNFDYEQNVINEDLEVEQLPHIDKAVKEILNAQEGKEKDSHIENEADQLSVNNQVNEIKDLNSSKDFKVKTDINTIRASLRNNKIISNNSSNAVELNQTYKQKNTFTYDNVFDKLYFDAFKRKNSKCRNINKSLSKEHNARIFNSCGSNYSNKGEELFYEGMKRNEKKYTQLAEQRKLQQIKLEQYCTFKPEISNIQPINIKHKEDKIKSSYQLFNSKSIDKSISPPKSNVYNYNEHLENKKNNILRLREKYYPQEEDEINSCTFHPKISANSNIIINQLNPDEYLDKKIKKQEKLINEHTKEYTFTPNILHDYVNKTNQSNIGQLNFEERQKFYSQISKNRRKELNEVYSKSKDLHTGQSLFQPQVNHSKSRQISNNQALSEETVYVTNYHYASKYKVKKLEEEKKYVNLIKSSTVFKANPSTDTIYEKMKIKSFSALFTLLDSDMDNKISAYTYNNASLDAKSKKIISPIIKELREENETLNRIEFNLAMNHIFEALSYDDKKFILNKYKNLTTDIANHNNSILYNNMSRSTKASINKSGFSSEHLFKPQINSKSKILDMKNYDKAVANVLAKAKAGK